MTKHKKIISVITLLLLLASVLAVTALADTSVTAEDGAISYAEGPTDVAPETRADTDTADKNSAPSENIDADTVDKNSAPSENIDTDIADKNSTPSENIDADTADKNSAPSESVGTADGNTHSAVAGAESENPMEQFFTTVREHLAEILSALTLIGSLILAFAFKKGLLPLMRGALGRLGDAASATKTSAEDAAKEAEGIKSALIERTSAIETASSDIAKALEALGEEVKALKEQGLDKKLLYGTLGAEVELLYDIFMSSSLPNFQKEAVSQRLKKMKEELTEGEEK